MEYSLSQVTKIKHLTDWYPRTTRMVVLGTQPENFIYTTGGTFGDAFDPAAVTELPWGSLNKTR